MSINYRDLVNEMRSSGDESACVPISVSIVTGESLKDTLAAFELAGRKFRKGCSMKIIDEGLEILGYKKVKGTVRSKTVRTVERELKERAPGHPLIVDMKGHWAAWNGSKIDDHTAGRCRRINGTVYKLVKISC